MLTRLAIASAFLFFACSSDGGGNASIDAAPDVPDGDYRSGDQFTVTWGPYDVPAGDENTKCMIQRLGNDRQIHVGEITNDLGTASHHFIVYRIAEGEVSTEPYDCQPFADTLNPENGAPLMVTQKAQETLTLPDGVAFTLETEQLIRLELHYLNTTNETQAVTASSTFTTMAPADFEHEADFLFVGNPDIELAPMQSATVGPSFLPLPEDLIGVNIFGITGHTHEYGTDVTVELGPENSMSMIYDIENYNWDEPETVRLEPPMVVPAEAGFRFSCDYMNTSNQTVSFGEDADKEMCFFWAYYYPSKGAKVCIHSDQYPGIATDLCCPGEALCDFILDQL